MTPEREVTIEVLNPGDPSSGDEAIFEAGRWENYRAFGGGALSREELAAAEREFHSIYLAILGGRAPWSALDGWPERLGVAGPWKHDRRPPLQAPAPLDDAVLAEIVEDLVPDWPVALERVTGDPFSRTTPPRVAALAFVPYCEDGRRPVDAWLADEEADRGPCAAVAAIDRSPVGVWADGTPLVPLAPRFLPPEVPGGCWVGRAVSSPSGWWFSAWCPLVGPPDPVALIRRLELELYRLRLVERRSSWEDVLRRRPEVVYRAAHEGARATLRG
jgi:hypothetical protein